MKTEFSVTTDFAAPSALASATETRAGGELLNLTMDDYDALFGGTESKSGEKVSEQAAMKMPAFWQGVDLKSGDVAKIPCEIYKRGAGTSRELAPNHPSYSVVRLQANPDQTAFEWRRQMMVHRIVWNNAYSWIERNGRGDVIGLFPLLPDRTHCRVIDGRKIYESEIDGKLRYFDSYDIWHVKGISFNGKTGLRMVRYARDEIGKILARTNFGSKFFKRGGRIGGFLHLQPNKKKMVLDKLESGFRKTYEGGDEAFKTVVLRDNAKFTAAQASFKDTQMVEVGQEDVRTVARLLNIPPHKLGAQGSTSYGSLEQENQTYYDNSLAHLFCEIESEHWLKLFPKQTRKSNTYFFEHTIGALLWADSTAVATVASQGIMAGWLTPNEARRWFNLNPNPMGDQLLVPSGMTYAGAAPATDEARSAIDELVSETERRFLKRLAVQARKAAKSSDSIDQWLQRDLETQHLAHGRGMFAVVTKTERAVTGSAPDHADRILKSFRGKLIAAQTAGTLEQTIGELCE